MRNTNEMTELTDQEMELAAGGCELAGVIYVDTDGDGNIDEIWLLYENC